MRYLLFFIVLFLHSYVVFAQPSDGAAPNPSCPTESGTSCLHPSTASTWMALCSSNEGFVPTSGVAICAEGLFPMQCSKAADCTCESPYVFEVSTVEGVTSGVCVKPDLCPSGFPKVNGQCPVCIGGQNPDGTCADEGGGSSAGSSVATSSPSSSGGGDGEDGGEDGGGGGDNGGGGNNNGGGGSASSSASTPNNGSNSSYTPHSGYGNWIPVSPDSACPNKYKDASGQWWCSGGAAPGQGSAASAAAGTCDPTSTNYWSCINSGSAGSAGSSGATSSDDSEGKLSDKGDELIEGVTEDLDTQLSDFEEAYTDDIDAFKRDGVPFDNEPSAIKSLLISFLPVSTPCNPPSLNFFGRTHELECEYFNIFKQAFGWFLSILTAYQIWQMAIRPVER